MALPSLGCAPHLFRTKPHPQPSPWQVQPPLWLPTSRTGIQNRLIQHCLSQLRPLLLDPQSWGVTEPGLPLNEIALWEESLQPPHWAFLTQPCISLSRSLQCRFSPLPWSGLLNRYSLERERITGPEVRKTWFKSLTSCVLCRQFYLSEPASLIKWGRTG